jgi:phasin
MTPRRPIGPRLIARLGRRPSFADSTLEGILPAKPDGRKVFAMQPTRFEIPEQMRDVAERSVSEARKAFEQFLEATQKAVTTAEGRAKAAGEGAVDISRQSLAFIEDNIAASFDLAQRLVQARTVEEMTALQQEFVQQQLKVTADQSRHLGEMVGRVAADAGQPNKAGRRAK